MFSIFNLFRRPSRSVKLPLHWHDPSALPGPPILIFTAPNLQTCSNQEKSVRWWNKYTPTVAGVPSPALCPATPLQDDSMHPIYGFNIQTGSSYLPDCDGDISWDTIRCSTEEGGHFNAFTPSSPVSSSATIATLRSGNLSDYCSSNASDSSLSMVITDADHEESFYFPAAEFPEGIDNQDEVVATALVLEGLLSTEKERNETVTIPFGDGFPPRRTSTITRLVGAAIRNRRSKIFGVEAAMESYNWGHTRRCMPHILTTILESEDED